MNNKGQGPLFVLVVKRIPGGYRAQARVATRGGYVIFCATARRRENIGSEMTESPKTAAVKLALEQAGDFAVSPQGTFLVSSRARAAIAAMVAVREVVERAKDGDSEARVGMRKLKKSPFRIVRKAVNAQRLFEE